MLKSIFLLNPIENTSGIYDGSHTNLRNKFTFDSHDVDNKYIDVFLKNSCKYLENFKMKKVRDLMFIRNVISAKVKNML